MDQEFQRKIKKHIPHRSWESLLNEWLNFLPKLDTPALPPEGLHNFYPLQSYLASHSSEETLLDEVEGLRTLMFHEGLFLLHKAGHVIGAAELQAHNGILTWSLSTAYQGALFGALAIMRLLGVATVVEGRNHWLVDLYPESTNLPSQNRKVKIKSNPVSLFLRLGSRVEHRHLWHIFQRLMRISRFKEPKIVEYVGTFSKSHFDVRDFARQRNTLHYETNAWFFQDMYTFSPNQNFGSREVLSGSDLEFSSLTSDYTIILSMAILHIGYSLLQSIASRSHKVTEDLTLFQQSISGDRHPIFRRIRFN